MQRFNKSKIIPALGLFAVIVWWAYRSYSWPEEVFPTWWDGLGLLLGFVIVWLLFRPKRRSLGKY